MSQITSGIRSVLSHPRVYSLFQALLGAHDVRLALVNTAIRPMAGMSVLDIGCGPAEILNYLPTVDYWGYDISELYIAQARSRFAERGQFRCKLLTADDLPELPEFDIAIAIGLLHHLDDEHALDLLSLAHRALKQGGRLVTLDPCMEPGQSPIARFLISRDRGQNVRTREGYSRLVSGVFAQHRAQVRHKSGIPYTHCILECLKI